MANALIDQNNNPTLIIASDAGGSAIVQAKAVSSTGALYVHLDSSDVSMGGGTEYTEDNAAAANPVGGALIMVRADSLAGITTTDGDNVAARGTDKGELYVKHADSIAVTNAGLTELAAAINASSQMDVNIAANGIGLATSAKQDTIIGHVDGIEGLLTTIDTDTGNIVTSVQLLDDVVATDGAATPTKGILIAGQDGTNAQTIRVDSSGFIEAYSLGSGGVKLQQKASTFELLVSVEQALPAGTNNIGDVDIASIAAGSNLIGKVTLNDGTNDALFGADNATGVGPSATANKLSVVNKNYVMFNANATWERQRNVENATNSTGVGITAAGIVAQFDDTSPTSITENQFGNLRMSANRNQYVTIRDGAGNERGLNIDANGEIGLSAIRTSVTPGTAATNLGKAEDGGHTSGDVGVMALGVRVDTPNTALSGTDLDYTPIATSSTGAVRNAPISEDFAVLANGPQVKKYYTNAGAVTDGIVWSPAAGKRWYITDIYIQTSAAATITLEDDKSGGDEAIWKGEFAANGGWSHSFTTPWFSGEDAADLIITTSAGNVYVMVVGYEI